jgi:hypothetical protein
MRPVADQHVVDDHATCSQSVDGQAFLDHASILEARSWPPRKGKSPARS